MLEAGEHMNQEQKFLKRQTAAAGFFILLFLFATPVNAQALNTIYSIFFNPETNEISNTFRVILTVIVVLAITVFIAVYVGELTKRKK
jgi:H+/gluconate symporter-like permease